MSTTRLLCSSVFRIQRQFSSAPPSLPWFVDPPVSTSFEHRPTPPHLQSPVVEPPKVPEDAPSPVKTLHSELAKLPLLEPATLVVSSPLQISSGPALPTRPGQGRRKRGKTYAGEGLGDETASLWDWVVMAQVKEGTENRGAIESVVRVVRKTLLGMDPPLSLPPNSKRKMHNGWAMVDAGNFAVHVMSREVKEKYFTEINRQW